MKIILLFPFLLFIEISSRASDTCLCPHIIEFGALDDPCRISVLTSCDTLCLYCDTSCSYTWFCDGTPIEGYSRRYWNIDQPGTHEYMLVVAAPSGCGDTARIALPDHGCCTGISLIEDLPDLKQASFTTVWDLNGRRILFQANGIFESLSTGIYIVEYTLSNRKYRKICRIVK